MFAVADLADAISKLPALLQAPATRWLERLAAEAAVPADVDLPTLVRLVAISDFAAGVLVRDPGAFAAGLGAAHDSDSLWRFAAALADSDTGADAVKAALRQERNRQLCAILWREIAGDTPVDATLAALSDVADALLAAACASASRRMQARFGTVRDANGCAVPMLVIGMGKLGGGELNFSSDIDIIFAYPADGESDGDRALAAQTYFERLSRQVVELLDETTADGFVFRTDTRLRPFGASGPPVISFAALESYLLQHGRTWERYAYVKARLVGPQPPAPVRAALIDELIRPFVYRGYLDFGVFEALRDLHERIAAQGSGRERSRNLKLGPGGIREIEFIVQSLQLVRGGSRPELQTPSLLEVLPLLVDERGLAPEAAEELAAAYRFLRRAENFLQAMRDQQTHDLPDDDADRARLALAMQFEDPAYFDAALAAVRRSVRGHFDAIATRSTGADEKDTAEDLLHLWRDNAPETAWIAALAERHWPDPESVAAELVAFRNASTTTRSTREAADRLQAFVPRLLDIAQHCEEPLRAVRQSLRVLGAVVRRSAYLALLNENRDAAERFVRLCGQSSYLSGELARFPVLLDELLDPTVLSGPPARSALAAELGRRLAERPEADSEERMNILAQYQRATMFRIAIADCSGALQVMQVSDSLTWLAEVILEQALAIAWQELVASHGRPTYRVGDELREAGFGIIAYGKLGGLELAYGSDLDVVFLHDSVGEAQETDGDRPLDNSMFFARLVRRLVHFMSTRTTTGALYDIDTRLRPSGRKGLLVTSTEAFSRYQEENAWTWEHQALLRARPVGGSPAVADAFAAIRADTLRVRVRRESLRADVIAMRQRMRQELDDSDATGFNLKHGKGGLGDIEFLVQYLVLEHAARHPAVIEFTDNVRQLNALAECGALPLATAASLQKTYRAYRRRQHRLSLNDEPARVPPATVATERAYVTECWDSVFAT